MKLFLSSTYTDLVDERTAAERVIIAMGQQFLGMEQQVSQVILVQQKKILPKD